MRLLASEFEKLTLWGIILVGWTILFFGSGGGGGWERILDRCGWVRVRAVAWGWVGVSGAGALFDNAHENPALEKKMKLKKTATLGQFY